MPTLRHRTTDDCATIVSWIPDADALYLFTGPRMEWPLSTEQLWNMDGTPGFSAWVIVDENSDAPIGHFDLGMEGTTASVRRVIIDPVRRGQGLASTLIAGAIAQARAAGATELRLNVIDGNEPALRSYLRAGFEEIPSERPNIRAMSLPL